MALRVRRVGGEPKPPRCHSGQEPGWGATVEKARKAAGQVCDGKTNVCETLLTHRNASRWHRNRGRSQAPGQRRTAGCVLSQGAACMLPWRCPVSRWREPVAGAGMEKENLSPRYRRPGGPSGSPVARGRAPSGGNREGSSTAGHRGGPACSSDEGPVMGLERRGRAGQVTLMSTLRGRN